MDQLKAAVIEEAGEIYVILDSGEKIAKRSHEPTPGNEWISIKEGYFVLDDNDDEHPNDICIIDSDNIRHPCTSDIPLKLAM